MNTVAEVESAGKLFNVTAIVDEESLVGEYPEITVTVIGKREHRKKYMEFAELHVPVFTKLRFKERRFNRFI